MWFSNGPIVSDIRGNQIAKVGDGLGERAHFVNAQIAVQIASLPRLQIVAKQALDVLDLHKPIGSADVRGELRRVLDVLK
jgi:hypothetical protein